MFLEKKILFILLIVKYGFPKIFQFNTSTNQQLENFLCVTESSHQKSFVPRRFFCCGSYCLDLYLLMLLVA